MSTVPSPHATAAPGSKNGLTSAERFRMALTHQEPDRVPVHDSPWIATVDRWHDEGLPLHTPVEEYFGYELCRFNCDVSPRFPIRILERNDEYIVETTPYGGVRRNHRDRSTTPEIVSCPIHTREEWEQVKPRLTPSHTRVDWVTLRSEHERATDEGKFKVFSSGVGYDHTQGYVRSEELLMAMVAEPAWVQDMFETHADLVIEMAKMLMDEGFQFDGAFMSNDMGYRNASLFSPRTYRALLFDVDRRLYDFFHAHDMPVLLHSCGCVKELIPHLIEAGLDCLQPLEVKAGMDLIELKREYGQDLAFFGGIDVRAMADPDPSTIEEEVRRKFEVAMPGGGYIYHSDHSVPNNVSFDQYRYVMELVAKYGRYA